MRSGGSHVEDAIFEKITTLFYISWLLFHATGLTSCTCDSTISSSSVHNTKMQTPSGTVSPVLKTVPVLGTVGAERSHSHLPPEPFRTDGNGSIIYK